MPSVHDPNTVEHHLIQALQEDTTDPALTATSLPIQPPPPQPQQDHHHDPQLPTEHSSQPYDTQINNAKDPFSVLTRIPGDIASVRQRLFTLETPVEFSAADWDKYWPYIDNVWCLHHRHDASEGLAKGHTEKFWGGCRLQRKWDHSSSTPPTKGLRNRQKRETGTCQAKFKLTVFPDGRRTLERSTKEQHSHDLDHIDSVKRNTGVRTVVLDPFFGAWEPATIMAYLRDPAHFHHGRDMLNEAGGKYLERREVMNIITQNLRKLYPGIDVSVIKKEQEKYKAVKMCNYKGCNMSFSDYKSLLAHRKTAHIGAEKTQVYSHRKYTCPEKGCHRKKKSKGLVSVTSLREHQIKLKHWGQGTFHAEDGPQLCSEVTENDRLPDLPEGQAHAGAMEDDEHGDTSMIDDTQLDDDGPSEHRSHLHMSPSSVQQQIAHDSLLPLIQATATMASNDPILNIDPAMQSQPRQSQTTSRTTSIQSSIPYGFTSSISSESLSFEDREKLLARHQQLEQEMAAIRNIIAGTNMP